MSGDTRVVPTQPQTTGVQEREGFNQRAPKRCHENGQGEWVVFGQRTEREEGYYAQRRRMKMDYWGGALGKWQVI